MKKVLSITLATLATAALSLPVQAHSPSHSHHMHNGPGGSGFSMEVDLNWTEFGNGGTDYLQYVNPALNAAASAVISNAVTSYFHNLSSDFNAGGRLAYTMGERTFVLKGHSFETDHTAPTVTANAAGSWNVAGANQTFGGNNATPIAAETTLEASANMLNNATADSITSRFTIDEDRVQLGINRKIRLSNDHNFNANWEIGVLYLNGERRMDNLYQRNSANPIVAATIVDLHRDYTREEFDGYGAYLGVSGHSTPFGGVPCISLFGQMDVGFVWADNNFHYEHEFANGNGATLPTVANLTDVGAVINNHTKNLLANVKLRTGLGLAKSFSSFRLGASVYVDYSNTLNAFKNGDRDFGAGLQVLPGLTITGNPVTAAALNLTPTVFRDKARDLQHFSFGVTLAAAFGDGTFSFEAR